MKRTWISRVVSIFCLVLLSLSFSTNAYSVVKNPLGSSCKKASTTMVVAGKSYVCSYANKKLVWKLIPVPKPTTPSGPTWAEIEAEKAAVAAKAAEELRLKLEAEAKAAVELKARLEAEAKAAAELKEKLDGQTWT